MGVKKCLRLKVIFSHLSELRLVNALREEGCDRRSLNSGKDGDGHPVVHHPALGGKSLAREHK